MPFSLFSLSSGCPERSFTEFKFHREVSLKFSGLVERVTCELAVLVLSVYL